LPDNHGNKFTKFHKHAVSEPRKMPKLSKFMPAAKFTESKIGSENTITNRMAQTGLKLLN
jgi:hypothetical protein